MQESIDELIVSQQDGFTLQRPFYCDPDIFARDRERVLNRQWLLADHVSTLPNPGDYRALDLAGVPVIVVRDSENGIHAFHNVCRHRGSRICDAGRDRAARLSCPYHGWTWDLTGRLIGARQMPEGFDKGQYPLHACHVEVLEGLIFVNLSPGAPPDFETIRQAVSPYLRLHGLARAREASRQQYRIAANWKLVLENFFECYHCLPNHPEYCQVNALVQKYGDGSEAASARYDRLFETWEAEARRLGHPTGFIGSIGMSGGEPKTSRSFLDGAPFYSASRFPIRENFSTQSADGRPVAPLMGEFENYDGGETSVTVGCLSFVLACNDYATVFRYSPTGPEETEAEIIWLVDGRAEPGRDFDPERIRWMWHETTLQDQRIIENNQRGVNSPAYRPGPYSRLENLTDAFVRWYLRLLSTPPGEEASTA